MEKKLLESHQENKDEVKEYFDFIKDSVGDKTYFKDALNWYFFRYVKPVCDRTILIFGSLLSCVIMYFLYGMVNNIFPLVEQKPILISAVEQSYYFPNLVPLKPREESDNYDPNITTIDQAVLKYLVSNYVKERESFDFSKGSLQAVNLKFNRIRNLSDPDQYRAFQLFMSKDNPKSPIQFFGKDVVRAVNINSVRFIETEVAQDFATKARNFLITKIPTYAEIRFTATTISTSQDNEKEELRERFLVKINFVFEGAGGNKTSDIGFMVTNYNLFKIK